MPNPGETKLGALNEIPFEIVLDIVEYLPRKDVLSVRATSKRLDAIVSTIAFKTLRLHFEPFRYTPSHTNLVGSSTWLLNPNRRYSFCWEHGWFDGNGRVCDTHRWNFDPRGNHNALPRSMCAYHKSAVAETRGTETVPPSAHSPNQEPRLAVFDPVTAPIMRMIRENPNCNVLAKATEMVVCFDRKWYEDCGYYDTGIKDFERFCMEGMDTMLNAMPNLKTVHVRSEPMVDGHKRQHAMDKFYASLCKTRPGRELSIYVTILAKKPNLYWTDAAELMKRLSGISYLLLFLPRWNREREVLSGVALERVHARLQELRDRSPKLTVMRDIGTFNLHENMGFLYRLGGRWKEDWLVLKTVKEYNDLICWIPWYVDDSEL